MRNAVMVVALVCLSFKEILIRDVDQNVYLALIVPETKPACKESAETLVLEHVVKMQSVLLAIIYQCAAVRLVCKETHSSLVDLCQV